MFAVFELNFRIHLLLLDKNRKVLNNEIASVLSSGYKRRIDEVFLVTTYNVRLNALFLYNTKSTIKV
jgi:hypothetical protein